MDGHLDRITPPPGTPRTPAEKLRRQLSDRRIRNAGEPREVRLPIIAPAGWRLPGCVPAGLVRFTDYEEQR